LRLSILQKVGVMSKKDMVTEQVGPCWFVDLDWYQKNERSLFTLAQSSLCSKCRKQLNEREISADDLLTTIRDCCSKAPGFITTKQPIMESIFRIFLANGNQPLTLEELGKRLRELKGLDSYRTSIEVLSRLLKADQCYGLRQAPD